MPNRYLDEHGLNTLWGDIEKYHRGISHESSGDAYGEIVKITAEGVLSHSGTPTPTTPVPVTVVTGHEVSGKTGRYVSMLVRNKATNAIIDSIDVPLPSRGWASALPDGTPDRLSVDENGMVTWNLVDGMATFDGSVDEGWNMSNSTKCFYTELLKDSIQSIPDTDVVNGACSHFSPQSISVVIQQRNGYFAGANKFGAIYFNHQTIEDIASWRAFLSENQVDMLYPLATPVIEECGQIDLPTIPSEGVTISIADLDSLGVKYMTTLESLEDKVTPAPSGGIVSTQDGLAISPEQSSTGAIDGALLELTAKSKPAMQVTTDDPPSPSPDYPQPIVTVRGRNLIDESRSSLNSLVSSTNGNEITKANVAHTEYIKVEANTGYYVTNGIGLGTQHPGAIYDANKQYLRALNIPGAGVQSRVINTGTNAAYVIINYLMSVSPMLTLGSTPQPYVPYGYVGLERRDSQGVLLDTTPIPLPSRGWVAGLPDGTADELTVDGAGKVVWDCKTDETTTASTDGITGTVGVDVMSTTGQIADGATVLYKHTATETCGYIDLPDMQDCVLSIPELDALGVRYTIGDGAEIARQWYQRAYAELGDAIVDLTDRVVELEQRVPGQ